jgi:hypothetical protein
MDETPIDGASDAASGEVTQPAAAPATTSGGGTLTCDQCHEVVPDLPYCVRCGNPLGQERAQAGAARDRYAAAPEERATSVRLVSTVFPALPREEIRTFQLALVGGTILVVALALLGFFPVAIVAAAILVPLLVVLYIYDVDVYENEPVRVIALTFLWGAITGALFAFTLDRLFPTDALSAVGGAIAGGTAGGAGFPVARAIVAPLVAIVLMVAGPLVLLPYRRFNDVLDGATFGVASGVAFVGAQTLVSAIDLFEAGIRPVGEVLPWVVRLLSLGVAMPIIAAGAIGGLAGVAWLRYRAPVRDRNALGPFGQPLVAAVVAIVLMVGAAIAVEALGRIVIAGLEGLVSLAVMVMLAVVALVWLRRIIHLGLLQESRENAIGEPIACPNCGKQTPYHTFCGHCGVSLAALPKAGRPGRPAAGGWVAPHEVAPGPEAEAAVRAAGAGGVALAAARAGGVVAAPAARPWLSPRNLLAIFAGVLLVAVAVAAIVAFVITQGHYQPDCPDRTLPCAGAAPGVIAAARLATGQPIPTAGDAEGLPFPAGEVATDESAGFSVEFDPTIWEIAQRGEGAILLSGFGGAIAVLLEAAQAGQMSPDQIFEARRGIEENTLLGFASDSDLDRALLGTAILGHRPGIGGLFGGALDTPQGPGAQLSVALIAATDGQISVVATVIVPFEQRVAGFQYADSVINTFTWPTDAVVP